MSFLDEPWALDFHSGIPVYKQIVNRVRAAITEGRMKTDDQLPSVRALHQKLGINPNTVAKAYRELELTGLICTQHGSGCFVAPAAPVERLSAREKKERVAALANRLAAEAESQGIALQDLLHHFANQKPRS